VLSDDQLSSDYKMMLTKKSERILAEKIDVFNQSSKEEKQHLFNELLDE